MLLRATKTVSQVHEFAIGFNYAYIQDETPQAYDYAMLTDGVYLR